jgi:chemotaxis protein MotB
MAKKEKNVTISMGAPEWLTTYSDMVTLLLCFFIALFNVSEVDEIQLQQMISSMNNIGMGAAEGGATLTSGRNADLGNTIMSLPSLEKGQFMSTAKKKATSLFNPEVKSNKVRVTSDERGLVISLASDAFFRPGSAEVDVDATRDILLRLATLLGSQDVADRKFRIEGHTDAAPVDPAGGYKSNWELSAARAINVLHFLTDLGLDENRFQVSGLAATVPLAANDSAEGRAYNRRVDIIVLDSGHL